MSRSPVADVALIFTYRPVVPLLDRLLLVCLTVNVPQLTTTPDHRGKIGDA